MKSLLVSLIGGITIIATLPAAAGPDFREIEKVRQAARRIAVERHGDASPPVASTPSAGSMDCETQALILPLDHGPRAQTTPYLNRLRKERHEAQVSACKLAKLASGN